jgi:hypothetical protein
VLDLFRPTWEWIRQDWRTNPATFRCGGHGLGHIHRLQPLDGSHGAHTALDLDLSLVHHRLRDVCLGCLDPAEFWHAGQLPAVGHYRLDSVGQDVDDLITFS